MRFGSLVVALLVLASGTTSLVVALDEVRAIQCVIKNGWGRTYLSKSFEALLLGVGVDVGSDEETNDVEERHPGVLGQELLRKGQCQRRGHPADLHDGEEAGADGRADLVQSPCSGDDGHRRQIHGVLDRGDLGRC